jgi:hypothetical protein
VRKKGKEREQRKGEKGEHGIARLKESHVKDFNAKFKCGVYILTSRI